MSTYNSEKYLEQCLKSILSQTYGDFEVQIIDDNSNDSTVNIIKKYSKIDSRIKLLEVNSINKGLTVNLNKLLMSTTTEYIARMDSDDIMHPNRLESQLNFLESNREISIVGSYAQEIDEEGNFGRLRRVPIYHNQIFKVIDKINPLIHPSIMFKREEIIKIGGYNENYRFAQDYELWYRSIANDLKIENIPKPLLFYRVGSDHVEKRGMNYRKIDAKIRWNGTKSIGLPLRKRLISFSLPLIFGLMPNFLKRYSMNKRNLFESRF